MPSYDLTHETRGGRCCWCWQPLGELESHTVVRAKVTPALELRFHHACWPIYRSLSDLETKAPDPWTPQRVEELRIRGGYNMQEFASRLHCKPERLRRYLNGDDSALGPTFLRELNALAATLRFARSDIDWSDDRAFFCLCRHLHWSILDACQHTGSAQSTLKAWLDQGVPRSRPNTWMKLSRIARKHDFDAGMIVDDRRWTAELIGEAIAASTRSVSTWAALAGLTEQSIRNYRTGRDTITRNAAWGLTRAAAQLGVSLPPIGRVPYCRPQQNRHVPTERKKRWTPEMIALLGTVPDSDVARQLRVQPAAVAKQRKRLGILAYTVQVKESATMDHHSAVVEMELRIADAVLRLAQLGPDFLIVDRSISHADYPPCEGEIRFVVDGKEQCWCVKLPDGVRANKEKTPITPL